MPPNEPISEMTPEKALRVARLIWGVLLAGQVIFAVVAAVLIQSAAFPPNPAIGGPAALAAAVLLVLAVPIALFLRGQTLKRGWVGETVRPGAYVTGNIIVWAAVDVVTFLGLFAGLLGGALWPYAVPAAAGLGLFVLLWPNGRAMQPTPPPGKLE